MKESCKICLGASIFEVIETLFWENSIGKNSIVTHCKMNSDHGRSTDETLPLTFLNSKCNPEIQELTMMQVMNQLLFLERFKL